MVSHHNDRSQQKTLKNHMRTCCSSTCLAGAADLPCALSVPPIYSLCQCMRADGVDLGNLAQGKSQLFFQLNLLWGLFLVFIPHFPCLALCRRKGRESWNILKEISGGDLLRANHTAALYISDTRSDEMWTGKWKQVKKKLKLNLLLMF